MKKYFILFVTTTVLIIIVLYFSLQTVNEKQSAIAGDKFYKVLFTGDNIQSLLNEKESNWKHLAKFEYAAKNPTLPEALSIYSDLASDKEVPTVLRELAQYLEVMNSFYHDKVNGEKLELNTVYPYSSKEAMAIIKIHNNDIKGAIEILYLLLSDKKCPALVKANAHELLQVYER